MRTVRLLLTMTGAALLLAACGRDDGTRCFVARSPSADGWETGEVLDFPLDTVRQAGRYALHVGVRTSAAKAYPYRNLALRVSERVGDTARTRLLRLVLTDRHGDINGRGVSRYRYEFPADTLRLEDGEAATVEIAHDMRRQILPGITDVSVRLEWVGP